LPTEGKLPRIEIMAWYWLVQNWLRGLAEAKIREAVVRAARDQMSSAAAPAGDAESRPCDVGAVFALGEESGGLEDLLEGVTTTKGDGFLVRQGDWSGRRIAVAVSGAGRKAAARAAESLILGHRPTWVFSAGFCGGLSPKLQRRDLLVADRIVLGDGSELPVDLEGVRSASCLSRQGVHVGRILTVDEIVRRPREKQALGEAHNALGVDLESFAVAEVCSRRQARFLAVRVVSDAVGDQLPREVERLSRQKTRAARLGAALGAFLDRPGALKEMYQLKENAWAASDRLAKFLAALIAHLVPAPREEERKENEP
jgi:adenosylhomocysteine nucleosidase